MKRRETGATPEEIEDATRDEFDDICDENARLRTEVATLRGALERIAWHGLTSLECVEVSRRALTAGPVTKEGM